MAEDDPEPEDDEGEQNQYGGDSSGGSAVEQTEMREDDEGDAG